VIEVWIDPDDLDVVRALFNDAAVMRRDTADYLVDLTAGAADEAEAREVIAFVRDEAIALFGYREWMWTVDELAAMLALRLRERRSGTV
jgi:hypothetical protein